jgi:hypothetical protein
MDENKYRFDAFLSYSYHDKKYARTVWKEMV